MNWTPLEDAYKTAHVMTGTYGGTLRYSPTCIFCMCNNSIALMNDGGAFRQCIKCRKNFKAKVINEAVNNFSYSTHHLRGTN